ncbi:MAG TPA: UDP-N-acetylmuramoylalanine--D-glutamate ligase, partial [Desulfomicrobium sp.]|nr:UDP-N-acetylmuramoylalanine--D-glutamate ligase [Desulfomicrobium sp.]
RLGATVRLLERSESVAASVPTDQGFEVRGGEHRPEDFQGATLVVLSPGIPRTKVASLLPEGAQVVSELELASWFVSEPIIAVTGTNGKTTTTTLIGRILERNGRSVFVGGNIGTPLSDYVTGEERADLLVLEVSSF